MIFRLLEIHPYPSPCFFQDASGSTKGTHKTIQRTRCRSWVMVFLGETGGVPWENLKKTTRPPQTKGKPHPTETLNIEFKIDAKCCEVLNQPPFSVRKKLAQSSADVLFLVGAPALWGVQFSMTTLFSHQG